MNVLCNVFILLPELIYTLKLFKHSKNFALKLLIFSGILTNVSSLGLRLFSPSPSIPVSLLL